jgi:hypothetical protein
LLFAGAPDQFRYGTRDIAIKLGPGTADERSPDAAEVRTT